MLNKYKCSKCETIGEAVSETHLDCPVCGAAMLQLNDGEEFNPEHGKGVDSLPEAKVVSLGFYDLLPIPAGSKLDMFRQKLQATKLTDTIQGKDSTIFKGLADIVYKPINDDIPGSYKKQKSRQIRFYFYPGAAFFILLLILFYGSYKILQLHS